MSYQDHPQLSSTGHFDDIDSLIWVKSRVVHGLLGVFTRGIL